MSDSDNDTENYEIACTVGGSGHKRQRPSTIECRSPSGEKRMCLALTPSGQIGLDADKRLTSRSISPSNKRASGRWTKVEDETLRQYVQDNGAKNWKEISVTAFAGTRTDVQCLHRWYVLAAYNFHTHSVPVVSHPVVKGLRSAVLRACLHHDCQRPSVTGVQGVCVDLDFACSFGK